ncbi:MAG: winged helix-turn-helix domain-containing protein [Burkholderiales bacterium]|nr:winged helix-turn-helix domain-containing protein [Burkholderiales bacterium]
MDLKRISLLIARRFRVKLSESQVCRILAQMNFSCQRPEKRAIQRALHQGGEL